MTVFEQGLPQEKNQAVKHVLGLKPKPPQQHPTGQKGSWVKGTRGIRGTREAKATERESALVDYASRGGGRGGVAGSAEVSVSGAMAGCHEVWPSRRAGR